MAPEAAEDQVLILADLHPGVEPADTVDEHDAIAERATSRGHDCPPCVIGRFDLVVDLLGRSIVQGLQGRLVPVIDLPRIYTDAVVAEDPEHAGAGHGAPCISS